MTVDDLASYYTPRIVVNEVFCVLLLALNMFIIWSGPGGPWGTIVTLVLGSFVIARVWWRPNRYLRPVRRDAPIDRAAAIQALRKVSDPALRQLLYPTLIGFAATLLSWGWLPVFIGALMSLAGYTFLGPFRSQIGRWRDRMEFEGGKTGL
jgi:hypothetical protein